MSFPLLNFIISLVTGGFIQYFSFYFWSCINRRSYICMNISFSFFAITTTFIVFYCVQFLNAIIIIFCDYCTSSPSSSSFDDKDSMRFSSEVMLLLSLLLLLYWYVSFLNVCLFLTAWSDRFSIPFRNILIIQFKNTIIQYRTSRYPKNV